MRIVAGRFRRRKLRTNPGVTTRPIPDRIKESLFNRLDGTLDGRRVADVFAGTGTIGLEALSRGAASVVFFEKDRKAAQLLRENIQSLKVEAETFCWNVDVLKTSYLPKGLEHRYPYDFVFFDPPYRMISELTSETAMTRSVRRLSRHTVTSAGSYLILRTPRRAVWSMPDCWQLIESTKVSTMELHLFQKSDIAVDDAAHDDDSASDDSASIDTSPHQSNEAPS